ncbi:MAG: outer membrane protein assembly factor BamA, partial [Deltaproteobacteria bacterium]|nr:outer membrane protein assembly factor BamA [Deltaproteobacteria bacterium]
MVNYSRKKEGVSLQIISKRLRVKRKKARLISLFFLALLPAILACPVFAFAMDKVAVLPFKIITTEPAENLGTSLQEMFSQYMNKMGYQTVNTEMINGILGDDISFSDPENKIIPFGKTHDAGWIIMGEVSEKDGSFQLNVKALDTDTAKTPFSVMMIEKDRSNLSSSLKKIAESLSSQIKDNILISDIIVRGSKRADEAAILNIIESRKGDQFDQEKLDRDLRTIYKMGFFDDVNYDISDLPDGKVITFNLDEKPTIIKITFEGNKYKKEDKLVEEIGIKKYSVLNRNEVKQSINRLLEFYRNDGYYNVEIKGQIKDLQDENEVILTYVIKEGEKVYIKNIQFKGNKVFDSDDLKDIMLTKEKGWLTWFTDSGVLDKKKLELHDLQKLKIYYDNHGYITAQIGDPEITYDEKEEGLTLTIPVTEGEQYMVNDVIIEGELLRPADELRKLINVKKGDPFSRQVFYTEKDKISSLYADMGYAYADVSFMQPRHIEGTNLVDAILNIQKNKRVRIERINIYGNEITKDKVIRRELKLLEGDYFSGLKLEKSRENITRLDLYKEPEIKTRKG